MRGAIPPLPNTPSWRGAQEKSTGTTLPFTFSINNTNMPAVRTQAGAIPAPLIVGV